MAEIPCLVPEAARLVSARDCRGPRRLRRGRQPLAGPRPRRRPRGAPGAIRAGSPPKLSSAQRRSIPELLWHGPEAYGFRGRVWICTRVARVIEEEFGVRYNKDHVGRLLKGL